MPKTDAYEREILRAFARNELDSIATRTELARFEAAARATAVKDRRINIRLSSGDLSDLQVKALEQGVPYQTLIASVLHRYVTGRLTERATPRKDLETNRTTKRRATSSTRHDAPALEKKPR